MKLLSLVILLSIAGGCSSSMCGDTTKREVHSPDGTYVATWFVKDCGATTDYSTQVAITRAGSTVSDDDVVFIAGGEQSIGLAWQEDSKLAISCEECKKEDVFKQTRSWGTVEVTYEIGERVYFKTSGTKPSPGRQILGTRR